MKYLTLAVRLLPYPLCFGSVIAMTHIDANVRVQRNIVQLKVSGEYPSPLFLQLEVGTAPQIGKNALHACWATPVPFKFIEQRETVPQRIRDSGKSLFGFQEAWIKTSKL